MNGREIGVSLNNSILALLTAFFFAKSDSTEWYWWTVLGLLVLMDEINAMRRSV
jgi:hypothetical protein